MKVLPQGPAVSLPGRRVFAPRRFVAALSFVVILAGASAFDEVRAEATQAADTSAAEDQDGGVAHTDLYDETFYPTATQCGECHEQIYYEWSSSQHAYASISPMFHKFEQKFQDLTQGTVGSFCVRCHAQVGTQLGEPRDMPLWERSQVSREGVTCITCHRVNQEYGKVNGERRVVPGKIYEPIYGSGEGSVIKEVIDNKDTYTVATKEGERGNEIHGGMVKFDQISKSEFCVSCHQVAVNLGIKLEIVWEQYRDSPAREAGITCQDCHMGKKPGKPSGYATAPSAVVGGREINPGRKHADHRFIGPGLLDRPPGNLPAQQECACLDRQGMDAVRLAGRLGLHRLRGQGRRRPDRGRLPRGLGRSGRP